MLVLTISLYVTLYLIPFSDQIIEPQPDGKNLGRISGEYFRLATLAVMSIPFIGTALFSVATKRFGTQEKRFGYGSLFVIGGFWIVTVFFRHLPR